MSTEADTCRKFVVPKLQAAGWDSAPHSIAEQRSFTDGRIIVRGNRAERKKTKRADHLLRLTRDFPIAVVEAKAGYKSTATVSAEIQPMPVHGNVSNNIGKHSNHCRALLNSNFK
jgi:type I site-specific restriction endonuclease